MKAVLGCNFFIVCAMGFLAPDILNKKTGKSETFPAHPKGAKPMVDENDQINGLPAPEEGVKFLVGNRIFDANKKFKGTSKYRADLLQFDMNKTRYNFQEGDKTFKSIQGGFLDCEGNTYDFIFD
jgi:hypothetical protein